MSIEDIGLLSVYVVGWSDCGDNNDKKEYNGLYQKAYDLGWNHFIMGDEISSIDYLSNEEIIKLIKDGE